MPEPWTKRPDESAKAFAAFQAYRDQPPMERSLRRVADALARSHQLIAGWSSKHAWVSRVTAWDREQDRLLQQAVAEARRAFAEELAATGAMMRMKGISRISSFVDRVDQDGYEQALRPGQEYIDSLSVADATRLIETGARLEALGLGLPKEQIEGQQAPTNVTVIQNPVLQQLALDPSRTASVVEAMGQVVKALGAEADTDDRHLSD